MVTEHGWWITRDGLSVCRRDAYGQLRTFRVGIDGDLVIEEWIIDRRREEMLGKCGRVVKSLHRAEVPGLAQREDLPFFDGHRLLLEAATGWSDIKAALATGCSYWHTFGRTSMSDDDPRRLCKCGLSVPSRPRIVWSCPAFGACRIDVPAPRDRAQARLFAVAHDEEPRPPLPLDVQELREDLHALLISAFDRRTAFVASDGSAKHGAATVGIFVPACDQAFGMLVEGEGQTAYAAEVSALVLILRSSYDILYAGPRQLRKLVLVSDCMAAINTVRDGQGGRHRLATECRLLLERLSCWISVDFVRVPSHGKFSRQFRGHAEASEAQLRAWNAQADRIAGQTWQRLAEPSARVQWWQRRHAGTVWESKSSSWQTSRGLVCQPRFSLMVA